jgi:hypothetical protein
MSAVSLVALTNVVGRSWPFHCTREPVPKPVPVTVTVKSDPTRPESGIAAASVGTA